MIIERYLLRETGQTFLGVSLLLVLIYLSGTLIRILADAAEGEFPVDIVMQLFALKGVGNLVFILPLSFFLGVLLALGRLYKDSEMAALTACGIGPRRIYIGIGSLALLVALFLGSLALYFAPWAEEKAQQLLDAAQASSEIEGVEAGRFNQSSTGGHLFYVEGIERRRMENVFGYGEGENGRANILAARRGYQEVRRGSGDRYLVFVDGHRYEGRPGLPEFKVIEFAEHGVLIREREIVASHRPRHAIPSTRLLASDEPGDAAELHWRIAVPITTVLLGLIAVPLARTSPRQGRYGKLFFGIVVYIIYNNLLTVARSSLSKGEYNTELGLWWVHGLFLTLALFLMWKERRLPGPRRPGWLDR